MFGMTQIRISVRQSLAPDAVNAFSETEGDVVWKERANSGRTGSSKKCSA